MRINDDEHFGVKQTQYTIEQAIEDDEIFRQIKAGKSPYTDVEEIKKMISQLLKSQSTIEHYTENFHRMLEKTGDVEPIKPPVKKKLTYQEQIKAEVEKRKAAETQTILKEVYRTIV